MSQFIDDTLGIEGGAYYDPATGNTALQSFGPSGCVSIEDQNDYLFALFDPNTGNVFFKSGDTLSGIMSVESVCAEMYLGDGFFKNYSLTDPSNRDLVSGYEQRSIVGNFNEVFNTVSNTASPPFSFGRSGNNPTNTWLLRVGAVPSNRTGYNVGFQNAIIKKIVSQTQDLDTYNVGVYTHDGDEVNLTLIHTVNIVSSRSESFDTSISVPTGKQLATRITSGSASNVGVDITITGAFV